MYKYIHVILLNFNTSCTLSRQTYTYSKSGIYFRIDSFTSIVVIEFIVFTNKSHKHDKYNVYYINN